MRATAGLQAGTMKRKAVAGLPKTHEKEKMKKKNRFPTGWNEDRVRLLLRHYEEQAEYEAIAEDEAAFRKRDQTVMVVPKELVPAITKLIERNESVASKPRPNRPFQSKGRRTRRG
jgi:hypothetical protein